MKVRKCPITGMECDEDFRCGNFKGCIIENLGAKTIYGIRTPNADSLALQTLSYRCMGATGMDEDAPLDTIPASVRSVAESLTGWPFRKP